MVEVSYIKKKVGDNEDEYEVVDAAARKDIENINTTAVFSSDIRNILLVTALPSNPVSTTLYVLIDS